MRRRCRVKWPSFMKSASAAWVSNGANWPVTLSAEIDAVADELRHDQEAEAHRGKKNLSEGPDIDHAA